MHYKPCNFCSDSDLHPCSQGCHTTEFPAARVAVPAGTQQAEGHRCSPQTYRVPEPAAERCNSRTRTCWSVVFQVTIQLHVNPELCKSLSGLWGTTVQPISSSSFLLSRLLQVFLRSVRAACSTTNTTSSSNDWKPLGNSRKLWLTDPVSAQWTKLGVLGQGEDVWSAQSPIKM